MPTKTWQEAVRASPTGITLALEVTSGADRTLFPAGFDAWRGHLRARVREAAQEGRANAAIVEAVAQFFNVPRRQVRVVSGATSRLKEIVIEGVTLDDALRTLEGALDGP